jgi:long-subunit fatty acid transport protein
MVRRRPVLVVLSTFLSVGWSSSASAGGLFAGDVGSTAQERGGAYVAKVDNGSALAINPAGLVKLRGLHFDFSLNLVGFHTTFDAAGVYAPVTGDPATEPAWVGQDRPATSSHTDPKPVPFFAVTYGTGTWAVAVGLFGPQGNADRHFDAFKTVNGASDAPGPQRYDTVDITALIAQPSIAGAFRLLPNLDLGLRASWGFGTVDSRNYLWGTDKNNGYQHLDDVGYDGVFAVHATDDFIPSFGAGLLWRPLPQLEVGAAYASAQKAKLQGASNATLGAKLGLGPDLAQVRPVDDQFAQCNRGGTIDALQACINLTVPQFAQLGARWIFPDGKGGERGDLELDARWENWSAASSLDVIVDGQIYVGENPLHTLEPVKVRHGFKDTFSMRLGGQYKLPLNTLFDLAVRGGTAYDSAAAPDSWSRVDLDGSSRLAFMGGVALETASWSVDLGGGVILSPDRHVAEADLSQPLPIGDRTQPDAGNPIRGPGDQPYYPINSGTTSSGYWILSLGATYRM